MQSAIPRPIRTSRRSAFSLIELMVVIVIIAILMSLLLNGVMAARAAALNASVVSEMKGLEKAIADFKLKYGVEPPSEIYLYETPAGWNGTSNDARRSRAIIRQIWPQFDFTMPIAPAMTPPDPDAFTTAGRDINGDKDIGDVIHLTGDEALVFFLGGMNATNVVDSRGLLRTTAPVPSVGDTITRWEPLGFSVNPTDPFARGGSRVGPQQQFDNDRLTNIHPLSTPGAGGMPEFLDALPGQTKPYLYASSYDGKGYRPADLTWGPGLLDKVTVYTQSLNGPAFNPKSFQIISPGIDAEYGEGGPLDGTFTGARAVEQDNITNFKGSRLN